MTETMTSLTLRIAREHERVRGGCLCGAEFGDSIDARWHLINQTRDAVVAVKDAELKRLQEAHEANLLDVAGEIAALRPPVIATAYTHGSHDAVMAALQIVGRAETPR